MEFSTHTYKIELRFNTEDKKQRQEYSAQLRNWRYHCVDGANQVFAHLFVLMNRSKFHYHKVLRKAKADGLDIESKEVKDKIKQEVATIENDEFVVNPKTGKPISSKNAIYSMLSNEYLELGVPSAILSALCNKLVGTFTKQKKGYLTHQRLLPNFKDSMPVPFTAVSIRNIQQTTITTYHTKPVKNPVAGEATHEIATRESPAFAFTLYKIPFITNFGRDRSGNFSRFQKAISYHLLPDWIKEAESVLGKEIARNPGVSAFVYTHDSKEVTFYLQDKPYPGKKKEGEEREFFYIVQTDGHEFYMKPIVESGKPAWRIASDYKLGDSEISIEKKEFSSDGGTKKYNTKIFLHAVIMSPKREVTLDDSLSAQVILGTDFPLKILFRDEVHTIGSYEVMKRKRRDIRSEFHRRQKTPIIGVSGHGTRKRLQVLESFNEKEKRNANYWAHVFSKKLIDFFVKFNIKHLILNPPEPFPADMPESARKEMIRTYGWAGLIEKINYKANDKKIIVTMMKEGKEEDNQDL